VSHLRHQLVERRWREPAPAVDVNEGERRLESAELVAAVERLLHRLPQRCRLALTLRWRRQMSYAEVARAMGISVKTVEIYVGRGLAVLRELPEPRAASLSGHAPSRSTPHTRRWSAARGFGPASAS